MAGTWRATAEPTERPITVTGWLRVAFRGALLGLLTFGGLALLLILRLIERPVCGQQRPWTPHITQFVCRSALMILGIRHTISGQLMQKNGAVVANHSTWLDIFVLNARKRVYFVSKSDVAAWPGIGLLARATGTLFIQRHARDAKRQKEQFEQRLGFGHKLLFFPEGTSTDGSCILPFKSTLFAAFFAPELKDDLWIQPVTVRYTSPVGEDARFYGWWGDMDFAPHLLKILAAKRGGAARVIYHPPIRVGDFDNRKTLAAESEKAVRSAFGNGAAATGD